MVRGKWTLSKGHRSAQLITDMDNTCLWGFTPVSGSALSYTMCAGKTSVHSVCLKLYQKNLLLFQSFSFLPSKPTVYGQIKSWFLFVYLYSFLLFWFYLLGFKFTPTLPPPKRHWFGCRHAGGFISLWENIPHCQNHNQLRHFIGSPFSVQGCISKWHV